MSDKWNKWTFVCPDCDAYVEYTILEVYKNKDNDQFYCSCGGNATLLSVVDVTIPTIPTKKEDKMETVTPAELYNPHQEVIYKKITNGEPEYVSIKVTDLEWNLKNARQVQDEMTIVRNKIFLVDNIINSRFEDSEDQDTLTEIAKALDISLTKEITWSATVTITGTMEIDITEEYDLESQVYDELSGELYNYDISIDDVEER